MGEYIYIYLCVCAYHHNNNKNNNNKNKRPTKQTSKLTNWKTLARLNLQETRHIDFLLIVRHTTQGRQLGEDDLKNSSSVSKQKRSCISTSSTWVLNIVHLNLAWLLLSGERKAKLGNYLQVWFVCFTDLRYCEIISEDRF